MPQTILVAEDQADIRELLVMNLRNAAYAVTAVADGAAALASQNEAASDLLILDLMMPGMDGLEVCKALRARGRNTPILMLTAKSTELDRVLGLELGADDYVTKPFSVRELILRIRAVLRRGEPDGAAEDVTTFGRLKVDRTAHRVYVDGAEVVLTALEFRLLSTLIERRNRVQSRDALLSDVWGLQMHVETRTVDTHIKRLREKLGAAGEYIHTVRGVGYRFASDPGDPGG